MSAPVCIYMAKVGDYVVKTQICTYLVHLLYIYMYIYSCNSNNFFSLQVKNKSHGGVAICAIILELVWSRRGKMLAQYK
jgi:hypothetical protein